MANFPSAVEPDPPDRDDTLRPRGVCRTGACVSRAEVRLHHRHHPGIHLRVGLRLVAVAGHLLDDAPAEAGGHHDHRVAEVHGAALAV